MEAPAIQWGPALGILALGLVLGALLLWRASVTRAHVSAAPHGLPPAEVRDLRARRDALYEQLRDLQLSTRRTGGQKRAEQQQMELAAARVLQALDEAEAEAQAQAPAAGAAAAATAAGTPVPPLAPSGFLADRPGLRGFVWGMGTMGALAALVWVATSSTRPRAEGEGLTGGFPTASGGAPPGSLPAARPPSPDEAALASRILENPEDLEARLDLARLHLGAHDLMSVWNETQQVLSRRPDHPRALSYQALVRVEMGQSDVALEMLKKAMALAPEMAEIHVHLIIVYSRMGLSAEADRTFEAALKAFPQDADALRALMAEIRRAAAGRPTSGVEAATAIPGALPPNHPRVVAADGDPPGLAGVIELDPGAAAGIAPGTVVFVSVRPAGVTQGPPVAAKRLTAAAFPLPFTIGAADSMMGQALPARVRVEARVDSDGNPMTRAPGDPVARLDDIAAGQRDLRLVLRRE